MGFMESENSKSDESQATVTQPTRDNEDLSDQWISEKFEALIPKIQERWPDLAQQTLEATRGSLDEVIKVIAEHSGKTNNGVKEQLEELFNSASDRTRDIAESLQPLEKQLEELLDDLNETLRPRLETPIKEKPIMAVGIAAGIGLILGILLTSGRRGAE